MPADHRRFHGLIAQRTYEIENHIHSHERWFESAGTPTDTHKAVRLGDPDGVGAFTITGGKSSVTPTWGSWVEILGSGDTPAEPGNKLYDLHRLFISDASTDGVSHYIQIACGPSGDEALEALEYTEFLFRPKIAVGITSTEAPVELRNDRHGVGVRAWARVLVVGTNGGTLDFCFGLHEYDR